MGAITAIAGFVVAAVCLFITIIAVQLSRALAKWLQKKFSLRNISYD